MLSNRKVYAGQNLLKTQCNNRVRLSVTSHIFHRPSKSLPVCAAGMLCAAIPRHKEISVFLSYCSFIRPFFEPPNMRQI